MQMIAYSTFPITRVTAVGMETGIEIHLCLGTEVVILAPVSSAARTQHCGPCFCSSKPGNLSLIPGTHMVEEEK